MTKFSRSSEKRRRKAKLSSELLTNAFWPSSWVYSLPLLEEGIPKSTEGRNWLVFLYLIWIRLMKLYHHDQLCFMVWNTTQWGCFRNPENFFWGINKQPLKERSLAVNPSGALTSFFPFLDHTEWAQLTFIKKKTWPPIPQKHFYLR